MCFYVNHQTANFLEVGFSRLVSAASAARHGGEAGSSRLGGIGCGSLPHPGSSRGL